MNVLQVEKMVKEAERFAKDDKQKREAIDTKNQADSVVYQTEKQLKEFGEKIPGEVKEKIESKLQELEDKIGSGSTHEIKDAMAALNQEMMQIGQSMYNQPGLEQRQELQVLPLEVKVIHHQEKVLMM